MVQYFTKEGLQKLRDELQKLKTKEAKKVADLLKHAAAEGDLKENAGYDDAKERQSWLLRRIAELESIVHDAIVREKDGEGQVGIGSKVKILFGGNKEEYSIVAPGEANVLENKISYMSPLGKELMSKKTGDSFKFGTKNVSIKILKIK